MGRVWSKEVDDQRLYVASTARWKSLREEASERVGSRSGQLFGKLGEVGWLQKMRSEIRDGGRA